MKTFKEFLIEMVGDELHRFDHGNNVPKSFGQGRQYAQQGHQSGQIPRIRGIAPQSKRLYGTFFADPKKAAPYSIPRNISWVTHENDEGKSVITVHKDDLDRVSKSTATLSKMEKSRTSYLKDTDEHITKRNNGMNVPKSQRKVNTLDHLKKHGYSIETTDDLRKHFDQAQKKYKNVGGEFAESVEMKTFRQFMTENTKNE